MAKGGLLAEFEPAETEQMDAQHAGGHVPPRHHPGLGRGGGSDSFKKVPPNATLSLVSENTMDDVVLTLEW